MVVHLSAASCTSARLLFEVCYEDFHDVTTRSNGEGPTPVSSLLHSCTLVMAGIFSFTNFLPFLASPAFVVLFSFSLLHVCLTSRLEKDLKRIIAVSTVIMVGFI